jgi:hypothetical protein
VISQLFNETVSLFLAHQLKLNVNRVLKQEEHETV